ncbi:MAG: hypothetical protein ACYDCL_11055 [Myxococcales bacterium]
MTLATLVPLVALAASTPPQHSSLLDRAIAAFESFRDDEAAALLREVLAQQPPGAVAAKAHLYLGLIALNAIDPDLTRAEFKLSLEANPAIELPTQVSPKAWLAFEEVRRSMTSQLANRGRLEIPAQAQSQAPPPANAPPPAPTTATSPAPSSPTVEKARGGRSHLSSYVLGGVTLLCAAAAIYGGVEVLSYQSMRAQSSASNPISYTRLAPAYDSARFWAYGWPAAAGLAAAGLTSAVLTW